MEIDSIVIVSLNAPKEKMWGRLMALNAAGITIQGIDLNGFDDWVRQVLETEPEVLTPTTVFYPMHRVERIAQDEPSGSIPSLAQRFLERVGISLLDYLRLPRRTP
ncbi:MAG: hypothetical protein HY647_05920 [Acidobacteria bacterium]|nr:hypothetical protein [Acidobacteriota bacterium]